MRINNCFTFITLILGIQAAALAADPAVQPLRVTVDSTTVSIYAGERPILHYQSTMKPSKVYIRELFTPSGVNILRDSPADHPHHHGLMYAIAADGIDFWSENSNCGQQQPVALSDVLVCPDKNVSKAGFTQEIDWIAPDGDKKLVEHRTIEVVQFKELDVSLVTWRSRFQTPADKREVELSGSHYFGLGMRFVKSMDRVGTHFNADGKNGTIVRGDERVTLTKWMAYTAPVDGRAVTVAMFDHPDNARSAHFFTMLSRFNYISATLNLWKEPMTIKAAEPLSLCYGVAVWDGKVDREEIEAAYRQWIRL